MHDPANFYSRKVDGPDGLSETQMRGAEMLHGGGASMPKCLHVGCRLDHGYAKTPTRVHGDDAGWDVYITEAATNNSEPAWTVRPGFSRSFRTHLHIAIPEGFAAWHTPRSSASVHLLHIPTYLIDCGFRGELMLRVFNLGTEPYEVKQGDRLTQLVFFPVINTEVSLRMFLMSGSREDAGLGSTGR